MVAITSPPSRNGSQEESPDQEIIKEEMFPGIRKTSRKQWKVQAEPRSLLKRLRSQLAEDGCPESQFSMAKALLEHQEDINYEENCHQAIFWLTQASLQGYLEATKLLAECFESGLGICEQNYQDVKRCLEMDHQEKLALVAGKQLFMTLAEGNEFVTLRKLETKISEIINHSRNGEKEVIFQSKSKSDMKSRLERQYGSERLSETSLVESALEFVRGELPSIPLETSNIIDSKDSIGDVFINFHYTILGIIENAFYTKFKTTFGSFHSFFVILCLCLVMTYYLQWKKVISVFLVLLWLVSFLVMCFSAFSIMIRRKNKKMIKVWAHIFQRFNEELNCDVAIVRYNRKFFSHYIAYFGCIFIYLMLLPFIHSSLKAFIVPPMCLVAFSVFTSLFQSNFSYNCLSSLLYVLAHYSEGQIYLKGMLLHYLPIVKLYIVEESLNIYESLCINLDIGSVFHGLWFVSLVFVSLTIGFSGTIIHCLCITWFHLTLIALNDQVSPWIYLSLILWCLVWFLPQGFNALTVIIPSLFVAICCFVAGVSLWISFSVFLITSILLYVLSSLESKLASLLKSLLFLLALVYLVQEQSESTSKVSSLKWEQFQNICLPTKNVLAVHTVRNCRPLRGTMVNWQASIKQVELESLFNIPETVISLLPAVIQPQLKCSLGLPPLSCEGEVFESDVDHQRCRLLRDAKGEECSLDNWNEYEFRFVVSMETTFWKFSEKSEVILVGGDEFKDVAFNLTVHDRISFTGTLDEGLGTSHPRIILHSIDCIDCRIKSISASDAVSFSVDFVLLQSSVKATFNFFFGPTLTL